MITNPVTRENKISDTHVVIFKSSHVRIYRPQCYAAMFAVESDGCASR